MNKKLQILLYVLFLVVVLDAAIIYFIWKFSHIETVPPLNINLPNLNLDLPPFFSGDLDIKKFDSEQEFIDYLTKAEDLGGVYGGGFGQMRALGVTEAVPPNMMAEDIGLGEKQSVSPERVSTTNVQVVGIDEPDIVKTDGQEIYFSSQYWGPIYRPMLEELPLKIESEGTSESIMPPRYQGGLKTIKAFPPADLKVDAELDLYGELLLSNDILVVFSGNNIYGYDVSNPAEPEKKWTADVKDNNRIVASRLYRDKIYVISQTYVSYDRPCPIIPMSIEGMDLEIKCVDIYHPAEITPVDVTFTVMVINPAVGKIEQSVSFVGSSSASVIYMSRDNIYVTYNHPGDLVKYFYNFLKQNNDLVPAWVIEKMEKLSGYDIGLSAKMAEIETTISRWQNSLDNDERLKLENELENRMSDYAKEHKRDMEQTGIFKIKIDGLKVTANGSVPGQPLNQFSLDEYNNNLRIATTVGGSWGPWGFGSRSESANDVYVLDTNLQIMGSIKDMGLTERIYSVRFIDDKGYVVTFRQTDPFYVLDLSNPNKPELKGELKIPGYSGYLHPLAKDKILGVGEEGWQVKLAIFDVSNPAEPKEIAKYILDEGWTEVLNNHHAFLLDDKFKVFFLPGGKGGYVFSYENDDLKMVKAISDIQAKRALYLSDYLYIIGEEKISVLNEKDWEKVNELKF